MRIHFVITASLRSVQIRKEEEERYNRLKESRRKQWEERRSEWDRMQREEEERFGNNSVRRRRLYSLESEEGDEA